MLVNRCEANVVFLDDGRVQAVEVEQQDVLVVEAPLRVEHQAAFVGRFLSLLAVVACVAEKKALAKSGYSCRARGSKRKLHRLENRG